MRSNALVSLLLVSFAACVSGREALPPLKPLGNPVVDARAALTSGDSTLLAIQDDVLEFPGTDSTFVKGAERRHRIFSRRTLGLSAEGWTAQRDSLRVYAAAYNHLVLEARGSHR
jgi:hypothetical protein